MTSDHGGGSITSVLHETRVFPPPAEFAQQGPHRQPGPVRGALEPRQGRPRGVLGRAGAGCCTGTSPGTRCSTGSRRSRSGSSAGELNASYNCVDRHCDGPTKNKAALDLGGRAGRPPGPALSGPAARGLEVRQRAQGPGREEGRRRRGLHAAGPRAGDRAPGLCPDRRAAHGDLRRLQRRGARRPHPGLQGQGPGHRRRRLSPRQGRPAQGERRRRRGRLPDARERGRLPADRHARSTGRPAATTGGTSSMDERLGRSARPSRSTASTRCTSSTPRARPASPRASCTRPAATCSARR